MKVDLTAETAQWVQAEIEAGRFSTADQALHHAISAAKLDRLRAELAAAEVEGGSFSSEEVRDFARQHLNADGNAAPGR